MANTETKQMKIEFINCEDGRIFTLPTVYTDRTEACVHGQNYCRDRENEDDTCLYFRVVFAD